MPPSNYAIPPEAWNDYVTAQEDFGWVDDAEPTGPTEQKCRACRGTGIQWRTVDDPCQSCHGEGTVL